MKDKNFVVKGVNWHTKTFILYPTVCLKYLISALYFLLFNVRKRGLNQRLTKYFGD